MTNYLYDATSGFYYDPETTLYYDPSSRVRIRDNSDPAQDKRVAWEIVVVLYIEMLCEVLPENDKCFKYNQEVTVSCKKTFFMHLLNI